MGSVDEILLLDSMAGSTLVLFSISGTAGRFFCSKDLRRLERAGKITFSGLVGVFLLVIRTA